MDYETYKWYKQNVDIAEGIAAGDYPEWKRWKVIMAAVLTGSNVDLQRMADYLAIMDNHVMTATANKTLLDKAALKAELEAL